MTWKSQEEYEAIHGTQEAQAKAQSSKGVVECDGPWCLGRKTLQGIVQYPHFVVSTRGEAVRKSDELFVATDIRWSIFLLAFFENAQ